MSDMHSVQHPALGTRAAQIIHRVLLLQPVFPLTPLRGQRHVVSLFTTTPQTIPCFPRFVGAFSARAAPDLPPRSREQESQCGRNGRETCSRAWRERASRAVLGVTAKAIS